MPLFDKLKSLFRGKAPARPLSTRGHRGTGGKALGGRDVEAFVREGELLVVSSSNVASAVYSLADSKLIIEYLDGSAYAYTPISESQAYTFAEYKSKGSFVWDYLRERGPGADHKHRPGIRAVKVR
jgi:hypothetical protein